MLYRSATQHSYDSAGNLHIRFSADEGATWSAEDTTVLGAAVVGFPINEHVGCTGGIGGGQIITCPNGDLLVHSLEWPNNGSYQYRSTDDGANWTDEGKLLNDDTLVCYLDYKVIGTTIYTVWMRGTNMVEPYTVEFYKSVDNGANWSMVGVIENVNYANESGVYSSDGTNWICVMRSTGTTMQTWKYTSSNGGVTWSARVDITDQCGKLDKPAFRELGGYVLLHGRDESGAADNPVVYLYADGYFKRKFYPDATGYADGQYNDILQKSDGSFYMITYAGTTAAAGIRQVLFSLA